MMHRRPIQRDFLTACLLAICGVLALVIVAATCDPPTNIASARRCLNHIGHQLGINSTPTCVIGVRRIREFTRPRQTAGLPAKSPDAQLPGTIPALATP